MEWIPPSIKAVDRFKPYRSDIKLIGMAKIARLAKKNALHKHLDKNN